ncbi:MAG: hypothetical protein ACK47N_19795 [Microcystis sp.]
MKLKKMFPSADQVGKLTLILEAIK